MVAGSLLDFDWTSGRILDDDEVRALLRAAVEREGNQVAFARRHGFDRAHLNMILSGKRGLSNKVIAALSLRKVYTAAK